MKKLRVLLFAAIVVLLLTTAVMAGNDAPRNMDSPVLAPEQKPTATPDVFLSPLHAPVVMETEISFAKVEMDTVFDVYRRYLCD